MIKIFNNLMRSKAKFLLVRQKLLNGKCAVRGETYKYEDREDGEDVSQPAHLLAGRSVVPRHVGGRQTRSLRVLAVTDWS